MSWFDSGRTRVALVPTDAQYQQLLAFRVQLRQYDQWSRSAAEAHGLTHHQHQLLVAIRGSRAPGGPTVGEVADSLLLRRHSATELVDRTQALGLVERQRDEADQRRVHLTLTEQGLRVLEALTEVHLEELARLAPLLDAVGGGAHEADSEERPASS